MGLKFVNLHGHTQYSIYDAIGTVEDYAEHMLKNAGEDSGGFALTDHGSINGIGSIAAAQEKYRKRGDPVKLIYGTESYYIPSISDWRKTKAEKDLEKKEKKSRKKAGSDEESELMIEDSKESKDISKYYDPIKRRNHLVLTAMNQKGLENLCRLVSRSFREGFYSKPRIDLSMLRELNEGLVASTACIAGIPSYCSHHPDNNNDEQVYAMYDKELGPLMEIFGPERFYLELQFNKLEQQRTSNLHLIEYAKRTGFNLIATADCHYPSLEKFKA